ncbi:MAG: methylthioribulose 1-phosphate dehydratase [Microcoleaceae cyanobacterium MO_207.B10]|nr:methylthioribulose 1-phosphate dehydratase [Microcoleaceae cyanobacterium MO_207.B10]
MKIDPRESLISAATHFYQKGWMVGTAGNLSARLSDGSFWITASGRPKGELTSQDFVRVDVEGKVLEKPNPNFLPSAETIIHQAIYQCFPKVKACYHVHSIEANLVSNFTEGNGLLLPPLEMLKGLGIWEENPWVEMPVFVNHLEVSKIAVEIGDRFLDSPPKVPALLIRNHGVTVWADSPESAYHYIELVEYIFRYMMAVRQVSM